LVARALATDQVADQLLRQAQQAAYRLPPSFGGFAAQTEPFDRRTGGAGEGAGYRPIGLHDLAAAHATRVAVMAEGKRAAVGAPADVLTDELLTAVYGHPVSVVVHPQRDCPLVLAAPKATGGDG